MIAPKETSDQPHPASRRGPVFVDASGRRLRRVRMIGLAVLGLVGGYVVLVLAGFIGGSGVSAPFLPLTAAAGPHEKPSGTPAPPPSSADPQDPGGAVPVLVQSPAAAPTGGPLAPPVDTAVVAPVGGPGTSPAGAAAPAAPAGTVAAPVPTAAPSEPGKSGTAPGSSGTAPGVEALPPGQTTRPSPPSHP
ncbi:hypothetical protein [Arthrobacter sp. SLBN-112]|uniref:hypothetical protein n=1 Tax=Arthrobacter sp. SLBN-112 TaxID=2768452 RepID=UPI0027B5C0D5|nr:hypothetical protein [Arthrobacter sp. SLBN-112]MDQ0801334.1 hypothetical protein [Arthrobacter sp. SLBN-112]